MNQTEALFPWSPPMPDTEMLARRRAILAGTPDTRGNGHGVGIIRAHRGLYRATCTCGWNYLVARLHRRAARRDLAKHRRALMAAYETDRALRAARHRRRATATPERTVSREQVGACGATLTDRDVTWYCTKLIGHPGDHEVAFAQMRYRVWTRAAGLTVADEEVSE